MLKKYLVDELPPLGTPERRVVRVALIDYKDRLVSIMNEGILNETLTKGQI